MYPCVWTVLAQIKTLETWSCSKFHPLWFYAECEIVNALLVKWVEDVIMKRIDLGSQTGLDLILRNLQNWHNLSFIILIYDIVFN